MFKKYIATLELNPLFDGILILNVIKKHLTSEQHNF